jgi:ubiquinone/menaquinone biosynthesis C-methylase UbiE
VGYLLVSPLRRLLENPEKLLSPFVRQGMTVVDYGCAMGFFTLPMARMVGLHGKVIAVDIQEKMLIRLKRRAERAGLLDRIQPTRPEDVEKLKDGVVDFAAAIHVVHELTEPQAFFREMRRVLKPGGKLLVVEPTFHVGQVDFEASIKHAVTAGFTPTNDAVPAGRAQVLQ